MTDKPLCGNCRFYFRALGEEDIGYCRRRSPTAALDEYQERPTFPWVHEADWCGEHERIGTDMKRVSTCLCCGDKFEIGVGARRIDAKFCSNRCRSRNRRASK